MKTWRVKLFWLTRSIRLESLQHFEIKCIKFYRQILSAELIVGNFRPFTIIPEGAFFYIVYTFRDRTF